MAIREKEQLKQWFRTGLYPAQEQFADWMDSYIHKLEGISFDDVQGLAEYLNGRNAGLLEAINEIVTEAAGKLVLERKIPMSLGNQTPLGIFIGEELTIYRIAANNVGSLSIDGNAVEVDADIEYVIQAGTKPVFMIQTTLTDAVGDLYIFARAKVN